MNLKISEIIDIMDDSDLDSMSGDESGLGDYDSSVPVGDSEDENDNSIASTEENEFEDMQSDRVNRRNALLLARVMALPNVTISFALTVSWSQWSDADDEYQWTSDEDRLEGDMAGGHSHNELSMLSMFMILVCIGVFDTIV